MAQSGRSGAVTIATNMAGRGTDIILGGNPEFMARLKLREMLMPRVVSQIEGENVLAQGSTTKVPRSHAPPLHPAATISTIGNCCTSCLGEEVTSPLPVPSVRVRKVASVYGNNRPVMVSCLSRYVLNDLPILSNTPPCSGRAAPNPSSLQPSHAPDLLLRRSGHGRYLRSCSRWIFPQPRSQRQRQRWRRRWRRGASGPSRSWKPRTAWPSPARRPRQRTQSQPRSVWLNQMLLLMSQVCHMWHCLTAFYHLMCLLSHLTALAVTAAEGVLPRDGSRVQSGHSPGSTKSRWCGTDAMFCRDLYMSVRSLRVVASQNH